MENQIQIICPSFGRTGTTSLEIALEHLGFNPVYSYFNCIKSGSLFNEWVAIFSKDDPRPFLLNHIQQFKVISDFPICVFAEYLIEQNPQAKVILATRDEEKWCDSILRLYYLFGNIDVVLASKFSSRIRNVIHVFNKHVWPVIFMGGELGDRKTAIKNYRLHIAKIKSITKPENLLEYNVTDAWEPLLQFLEIKDRPSISFPKVNKGMMNIKYTAVRLALKNNN